MLCFKLVNAQKEEAEDLKATLLKKWNELPDHVLPDLSFQDYISIFFNGEEIKLFATPGAHTDNDIAPG